MLSIIENGKWSFGIGDPTIIGWLIVAAYITAAVLCGRCAYLARKDQQRKYLTFWLTITIILALLAVNKQLDLQTLVTDIARKMAKQQGWYEHRRGFQMWVTSIIAAVGICLIAMAVWIMRNYKSTRMTFIGLTLLLAFIVTRAAPLHYIDKILTIKLANLKLRYLLELAAIACIAISAVISAKRQDKRQ